MNRITEGLAGRKHWVSFGPKALLQQQGHSEQVTKLLDLSLFQMSLEDVINYRNKAFKF